MLLYVIASKSKSSIMDNILINKVKKPALKTVSNKKKTPH